MQPETVKNTVKQWPGGDSNPHDPLGSANFKSAQDDGTISGEALTGQEVTGNADTDQQARLACSLAQSLKNTPELLSLIQQWSTLPQELRLAIMTLVNFAPVPQPC